MNVELPTDNDRAVGKPTFWIVLPILGLLIIAISALALLTNNSPTTNELPKRFDYSLTPYMEVDPQLVDYHQSAFYPVPLTTPRAIAVDQGDHIFVAGDKALIILDSEGNPIDHVELDNAPQCLTIDNKGTRFLGFQNYIATYNSDGKRLDQWSPVDRRASFTSVAVDDQYVYVADAGNKCVIRYDRSGTIIGRLAQYDPEQDVPPLVIPSHYFDVAVGSDGLLRVVNPGRRQIETFTSDGSFEAPLTWGSSSQSKIESFCGCCNPVAIALLADNRVVTAEKGIPRVKKYSPEGQFECVVATPQQLGATAALSEETRPDHKLLAVDLATDSRQRILVLDPAAKAVRVFVKNEE